MDIKQAFGNAIKELRSQKEISQEKFALQIGMDRTYYASIEGGHRNVSLENIFKIAKGFNLTVSEVFKYVEMAEIRGEEK